MDTFASKDLIGPIGETSWGLRMMKTLNQIGKGLILELYFLLLSFKREFLSRH